MNREEMIEKAAAAMLAYVNHPDEPVEAWQRDIAREEATFVLDAILPQVSTVEELEALPKGTVVVEESPTYYRVQAWVKLGDGRWLTMGALRAQSSLIVAEFGPLTVVWQP